jgi:hypothetical protein
LHRSHSCTGRPEVRRSAPRPSSFTVIASQRVALMRDDKHHEVIQTPSFRGDAKHRARNLEIPGLALTRHPGMTASELLRPRNDIKSRSNSRYASAIPRRDAPESCICRSPPLRAWGMPGARCTRSLVCKVLVAHECSHHRSTGNTRHSRTQWF